MIVPSEFSPRWWLRNPHVQTVLASQWLRPPRVGTRIERLELTDGDFVDLAFGLRRNGPIVAMLHGLAGNLDSAYVQGAFQALETAGFRPVLMHWRGCSGEPNRLRRSYHSGASDDIARFLDHLAEREPETPLYALGYSLGANALLKYLGEQGETTPLRGAVAVCPPLVLSVGADKLDTGLTRGYQRYLLARMRHQHERKRSCYPELALPPASEALNTFWAFDDAITAPLHGFADVHDYYRQCSSRQYLPSIRVPAHILYALDDPFFTPEVVPAASELASDTVLELSRHGGHVGFLKDRNTRWLDYRIAELLTGFRAHASGSPESRAISHQESGSS